MPALSRVIENTRHGDGTIKSKLRVTAAIEDRAKAKGVRAALRHNGYSDVVLDSDNLSISVDDVEVDYEGRIGLRDTYIVHVTLGGTGEFLQG